jgi:hypothetical protein
MNSETSAAASILETALERVDLSTRTANCCEAAGISKLGELSALSSLEIMRWRNAGRKTLREVREVLGSVGLKLTDDRRATGKLNEDILLSLSLPVPTTTPDEPQTIFLESASKEMKKNLVFPLKKLPLSVRAQNIAARLEARYLGDIAQLSRSEILGVSNAGRRTLQELETLLENHQLSLGIVIPDWSRENAVQLEKQLREAITESTKERTDRVLASVDVQPTSIESELRRLVRAVETERNTDLLLKLWGWSGGNPRVLESVGQEYQLTRERVRQIEARALNRFLNHQFDLPFLRRTICFLKANVPALDSVLSARMCEAGISSAPFSVWGIKIATETFKIRWPFDGVAVKNKVMLADHGDELRFRKAVRSLRRRTSDRGLTNLFALATEAGLGDEKIPALRSFLDVAVAPTWLDETHEWLFLPGLRNRLYNLSSKVLGVCRVIRVSELRRAVGKSKRLVMVPPQRVLGAFVERSELGTVSDDGVATANSSVHDELAPDSVEGLMTSVLDRHGPVMDGETFARRCVEAGVNPISFYIYRANSPLISALGKGVYSKVGADVPPGVVGDIVSRRNLVTRVSEHGWTSTGRLWFGFELTLQTMTAGGIRIISFVADLVQGEWDVILPDGTACGSVTCKEVFIWSFRKAFSILGAEAGDLAAFEFDLQNRKVLVKIGGPSLFEQIENPDTISGDDDELSRTDQDENLDAE